MNVNMNDSKVLNTIARVMVRLVPSPAVRCRMRRSPLVRRCIRLLFAGERSITFPNSAYRLYYDGYRNIGFVANGIEHCEEQEKCFIARIIENLQPTVIWDIGANIGTWSLFMTTILPHVQMQCFEPDSVNLTYLTLNKARNQIDTWSIRPVALSDRKGRMSFTGDPTTGSTGSLEREWSWAKKYFNAPTCELLVDVSTADDEIHDGAAVPQFVKCDVEGHELSVFRGGLELLRKHHPVILFEDTGKSEVADLLHGLGYVFYDMHRQLVEKPTSNTLAVHVSQQSLVETT